MSPSQDRKKRRRCSSQDGKKKERSMLQERYYCSAQAVLPLLAIQPQEEPPKAQLPASTAGVVLPLTMRHGTTARVVLPPRSQRYYRPREAPHEAPRKVRQKVRKKSVLPLRHGTTAQAVLPLQAAAVLPLCRIGTTADVGQLQWIQALFHLFPC